MMNRKVFSTALMFSLLASVQLCHASTNNNSGSARKGSELQVYLPREVTIADRSFTLGQVGVVRGDETLAAKANDIALGRISVPGQRVVVDRSVVMSSLACNGISASKVTLVGAEKVAIRRQQKVISAEEFVEVARSFLRKNPSVHSVRNLNPLRLPKDMVLPAATEDIKLSPSLVQSGVKNRAKVRILVLVDGERKGTRDVVLVPEYSTHRVVAVVDIPKGAAISPENVTVEEALSDHPEPANWSPPYGFIATQPIAASTALGSHMIRNAKPEVLIKRNQTLVIRIERPGLLVTAVGKAVQDGKAGDYIRVRNADSKRIILAKVNDDGSVEPVL